MDLSNSTFPLFDETVLIVHPKMARAMEALEHRLATCKAGHLVMIVGPAGCGKTTLAQMKMADILKANQAAMKSDLQLMAAVMSSLDALSPTPKFNWSNWYEVMLNDLQHPRPIVKNLGEGRRTVVHAIGYRRPEAYFIDEAGDFLSSFRKDDRKSIRAQANVIKSLARAKTKFVLIATYDLLPLGLLNGQLGRRVHTVHLGRYRNNASDRALFREALQMIQDKLGSYFEKPLAEMDASLYDGCVGVFGILTEWLCDAAELAVRESSAKIKAEHLNAMTPHVHRLLTLLEEAQDGERQLDESEADTKRLSDLLAKDRMAGRPPDSGGENGSAPSKEGGESPSKEPAKPAEERRKRCSKGSVGRPKPGGRSYMEPIGPHEPQSKQ